MNTEIDPNSNHTETPTEYEYSPAVLRAFDKDLAERSKDNTGYLTEAMNIAGIIGDVKPAALMDGRLVSQEMLEDLNLVSVLSEHDIIVASKDAQKAQRLAELHAARVQAMRNNTSYESLADLDRETGALLGYPATATDYFLKRLVSMNTPDELPAVRVQALEDTPSSHFHQIVLSPNHWKEELAEYCEPLEATMSTLMPESYEAVVHQASRRRRINKIGKFFGRKPVGHDETKTLDV